MPRISDKRERLLDAAKALIHRRGFGQTTLAHIAEEAEVPLGNVYYYFKTKDDIARAVIEQHVDHFREMVRAIEERESDPKGRLEAYLQTHADMRDNIAEHGCPVGSLCQELSKERTALAETADAVIKTQLKWVTDQFRGMGKKDARDLGLEFIARLQGLALLVNALKDPDMMARQARRLRQWLAGM